MSSYLFPIEVALILFPFLALFLTIPFAIYSYRKFGSITFMRVFIIFTFIFYLMSAFFLTLLPLPEMQDVAQMKAPTPQLIPFTFVREFLDQTVFDFSNPATYLRAMIQNVVIQPVFNIFLLFPLGVYLRYYFRISFKKALIISFLISLFFEVTQLTGIYGIYPHAYRLFDVDDLMLNTLGGVIGFFMAPLFTFFLPTREAIDSLSTQKSERVSYIRRLLAYLIDWFFIGIIGFILTLTHLLSEQVVSQTRGNSYQHIFYTIVIIFLYFIIFPTITNGFTPGKWIVRIRIANVSGTRVSFWQLLGRYALLYYLLGGLILVPLNQQVQEMATPQILLILFFISFLVFFLFVLHLIVNFFRKDNRLFYEKMSHTASISTFQSKHPDVQ
ncbi:VanZ family protein [Listeria valentina]|uniref:VanZ family protein n=1 Tax=Listeria valentina TaxID=2705293 RepID=UPI00142F6FF6|nr:VanZ family protein [Listeria valentina]